MLQSERHKNKELENSRESNEDGDERRDRKSAETRAVLTQRQG